MLATATPCHGTASLLLDACSEAVSVFLKSAKVRIPAAKVFSGHPMCSRPLLLTEL